MIHLSWKRCQLCIITKKNVFCLEICIAVDTKILKFREDNICQLKQKPNIILSMAFAEPFFRMNMIF